MTSGGSIRVLYIGGWGRSGSTLLDRMLGQVPGFASLGEVREIWQSGVTENRQCGCGAAFRECPFWSKIGDRAFGGWDRVDLQEALSLWKRFDRPWALPQLLARRDGSCAGPRLRRYLNLLDRLYSAVHEVSGADVLVDSSKLPSHALLIRLIPGVDLRLLHLVRDSRGVAHSWRKKVRDPGAERLGLDMERYTAATSALRWLLYNETTSLTRWVGVPYRRMRYEDLVTDPGGSLREAIRHAGRDEPADLGFMSGPDLTLATNHTVDGNPIRFVLGTLTIRGDQDWQRDMPLFDRTWLTVLTSPALAQYGYPLRASIAAHRGAHDHDGAVR